MRVGHIDVKHSLGGQRLLRNARLQHRTHLNEAPCQVAPAALAAERDAVMALWRRGDIRSGQNLYSALTSTAESLDPRENPAWPGSVLGFELGVASTPGVEIKSHNFKLSIKNN